MESKFSVEFAFPLVDEFTIRQKIKNQLKSEIINKSHFGERLHSAHSDFSKKVSIMN